MAVSLPTAADVRKAREQAARSVAEQAGAARTPLLAVLGVGDYALSAVLDAVGTVRRRADERADRVADIPHRLTPSELRRSVDALRVQLEDKYAGLAERGEEAWGRIRRQPRVERAIGTIEDYTERLDARVDDLVDDTRDAAAKALSIVTRETRSRGEKVARATQRVAGDAAETVAKTGKDVAETVAEAGDDVADAIAEAGDDAAHATRSTTRKAANRTAPRKPAAGRASTSDGAPSGG